MLSVYFSVLLILCAVSVCLGLPWLSLHLEEIRERENEHVIELLRQRQIIADYEATIDAYRKVVREDPEFALTNR
jgi:hypothetical protein